MSGFDIGLLMFAATLLLIGLRMPVGIAMLLVGGLGYAAITGWSPLFATLRSITFSKFSSYTLSVLRRRRP
jgi:C4-dicarboxylate transporter DctM subunit